jgi:hypothetical protein
MLFDKVTSIIKRRHGIEGGIIYQFIINGTLLPQRPPIQTLTAPDQNDINLKKRGHGIQAGFI